MKKHISLLVLCHLLLTGCQNDDEDFLTQVNHQIQINFEEAYGNGSAENVKVTLRSTEDGKTYSGTTGANGILSLDLTPGTFDINATLALSPGELLELSGQESEEDVQFNASVKNIAINQYSEGPTELVLVTGTIGNLLLKQIYFTGSHVRNGASFRDQFFEIHNNSNDTLYLDGLCFAQIYGAGSTTSYLKDYHLPNGQYDWSKSLYQTKGSKSNTDYVYADEVLQFPGSGLEYPLLPGKSTIVAATAINHKEPLTVTDANGNIKKYEVPQPELTIDLSNAPFEAYYRDYFEAQEGGKFSPTDIDNPYSVNMIISFKSFAGNDLILDPNGRDAFAIFYADEHTLENWDRLPLPSITEENIAGTTSRYLQLPITEIIDAVEIQNTDISKLKPKRLPDALDAGEIAATKGNYSSQSVIRKVAKIIGERTVYKDSNNSSEDFEVLDFPLVEFE
ncbi:DUF4876 domain-containing protein [Sinomicrobium sp. M5D2P9]